MSADILQEALPKPGDWTETEKWVWQRVAEGKEADLNKRFGAESDPANTANTAIAANPEKLDAADSNGWTDNRVISAAFLHSILLLAAYRSIPSHRGIRICGAWIKDPIDLSKGKLGTELWLAYCRFEAKVDLSRAQATDFISFYQSFFAADLDMNRLQSTDTLNLAGATIIGQLSLYSANIDLELNLEELSRCATVDLRNARIGRTITFNRVKDIGSVQMSGIYIGRDFFMRKKAGNKRTEMVCGSIDMIAAEIGGQVVISGATIREECDLNGISVRQDLYIKDSTIEGPLKLVGTVVKAQMVLEDLLASDSIEAAGLTVEKDLYFTKVESKEIDLSGARVGEQLEVKGCQIKGLLEMTCLSVGSYCEFNVEADEEEKGPETPLEIGSINLSGAQIGDDLSIYNIKKNTLLNVNSISVKGRLKLKEKASEYQDISMRFARITGAVELSAITVRGLIDLDNISIEGTLAINQDSSIDSLTMINAKIGNALELIQLNVKGEFDIQFANVARNIFIRSGTFPARLRISDSIISGSIITSKSSFSLLDLGGTVVQGELEIGDGKGKNTWTDPSGLNLRNTKVFALSDAGEESWPAHLELDEFAYTSLITGAWGSNTDGDLVKRSAKWFIAWLKKDQTYSSQPYNYLARTLNKSGLSEVANQILFAAKERERDLARQQGNWGKWIGFTLLKGTIGYGYGFRYFYSLIWVFALGLIGYWVLGTVHTGKMAHASTLDRVGFSLDILLPVIELNDKYKLDEIHGPALAYFYVHKVMGFILSSFVLAGLAGITKRESKE